MEEGADMPETRCLSHSLCLTTHMEHTCLIRMWLSSLVAFQTQTQNRRVLATQFPKSHPCPRW